MKNIGILILAISLFTGCKKEEFAEVLVPTDELTESSFTDGRDGITYKTVIIGDQEWMVENLRYRPKLGSMDGCWSYGELAVDTTQIAINKVDFKNAVLAKFPNITKFTDPYVWVWYTVDSDFVNSRGAYYTKSWEKFKADIYTPYYGSVATYAPLTAALDSIAASLKEKALIVTLDAAVVTDSFNEHGYLYEHKALDKVAPAGWRIPSDEDFIKLEKQLHIKDSDLMVLESWRPCYSNFQQLLASNNGFGGTIIYGINNQRTAYRNEGLRSYYWTSTVVDENVVDGDVFIRAFQLDEQKIYRGTNTIVKVANSVICVRDKK